MLMLKSVIILLFGLLVVCLVVKCEYVPHKVYELQTVNGETIKLSCPVIDPDQWSFTFMYKRECYVVKEER